MKLDESKDVEITITVSQKDRKLNISASVPDHAAGTVAMLVTELMVQYANTKLNECMNDDQSIQVVKAN